MLKISARRLLPILILLALTAAVSAPVYIQRILTPTENDFGTHIIFTQRLLKHDLPPTFVLAHPLLQLIIGFIYWAGRGRIGLWETGVLVQVLAQAATSLLLYLWIGALRGRWAEARRIFFALSLTLVGPIVLLALLDGKFYFGYIGLANYHNPTVHLLRPFALASFYLAARAFRLDKSPIWMVLLSAALMVAGALVKPNYAMTILPALAMLAAWFLWQRKPFDRRMLIWGVAVPTLLTLAVQSVVIFLIPDADKAGITIAPFLVELGYSGYLPLKFLLSCLFPLVVLAAGWKLLRHDPEMLLAWAAFISGVLQLYLLAETGGRFFDGNFRWSAQIALFLLFATSVRWLLTSEKAAHLARWQRWLAYAAYALHLAGGIAYYIYVFVQPHYS
jgi:hypothetical protein